MHCCKGATCSCKIEAGSGISVTGAGSAGDPMIVSSTAPPVTVIGTAFMDTGSPYAEGDAVSILTKQIAVSTDGSGLFDVLTAGDLADYDGVLSISVQPTGNTQSWHASPYDAGTKVSARALRGDNGAVLASTAITATVTAVVYASA